MDSGRNFFELILNGAASPKLYTLSLHDALPICARARPGGGRVPVEGPGEPAAGEEAGRVPGGPDRDSDRKSTRLNSSHSQISYAVFCLKKKISQGQLQTLRGVKWIEWTIWKPSA